MKKIAFLTTIVFVLLNFGNAFSQDEDIFEALDTLQKKLFLNARKLNDARVNLVPIDGLALSQNYLAAYFSLNLTLSEAYQTHNYLMPITMLHHYVSEDNQKWGYKIIYAALLESKKDLYNCYNESQFYFPYLDNSLLPNATEELEKAILSSIREIDLALKALSQATGL